MGRDFKRQVGSVKLVVKRGTVRENIINVSVERNPNVGDGKDFVKCSRNFYR